MVNDIKTTKMSAAAWLWWRSCCRKTGRTSVELFDFVMQRSREHHQHEMFISLPMPSSYRRPLEGKHIIDKSRIAEKVYGKTGSSKT